MNNMEGYDRYVGQTFDGRYRIIKIIGLGGMSVVFEAYDLVAQKIVALKMLRDEHAADPQQVRRFVNESKVVSMLSHPGIVKIFNYSVRNDTKYIAMEYIEGITLKDYIQKRGVLSFNEIISYTEQILHALEHAHENGIVHRDIKPQNIMLLRNGLIKVTDFGIAKVNGGDTFTITDKAIGTVSYISPEQAEGKQIDARSDLYSLGTLMYEMACGKLPFDDESPISVALMHINREPVSPKTINPAIPKGLEQIILSAMEKDRSLRFQSAAQMLRQIARLKADPNIVFKPNPKIQAAQKKAEEKRARATKKKGSRKQNTSMTPIILGIVSAFILVLGIFGGAAGQYLFTGKSFLPIFPEVKSTTLIIRDYKGMTLAEAKKIIDERYFEIKTDPKEIDNEEEWIIVQQIPAAGDSRKIEIGKRKCPLTFTLENQNNTEDQVYLFYESNTVTRVRNELLKLGFKVKSQEVDEYSNTVPKGQVTRTEPAAGQYLPKGSEVTIYRSLGPSSGANKTVFVPNFDGMKEEAAKALAEEKGLTVYVETAASSFAQGIVIGQEPAANTEVEPGTAVTLTVSGSSGSIVLPDLGGKWAANAKAQIEGLGLVAVMKYIASSTTRDLVVDQEPAASDKVNPGATVIIIVSGGPNYSEGGNTETKKMPSIVGLTESEAQKYLDFYGLSLGKRSEQYSDKPVGTIISQSPVEGEAIGTTKTVAYTVSLGKLPAAEDILVDGFFVPNIIGMSYESAIPLLKASYLEIGSITYVDSTYASGTIVSIKSVRLVGKKALVDCTVSK